LKLKFLLVVGRVAGIITMPTVVFMALFYYSFTEGRIFADPDLQWNYAYVRRDISGTCSIHSRDNGNNSIRKENSGSGTA
jgi:hypothetical protein